jgi:hypothetical protein
VDLEAILGLKLQAMANHPARRDRERDRATTAGISVGANVPADSRIPLSPEIFSLQRLMSKGR